MREIKFRAIIEREKTFREAWGIDLLNQKVLVAISCSYEWHQWKVLTQFTGLHDCEGKEIWEGDIVDLVWKGCLVEEKQQVVTYQPHLAQFRFGTASVTDLYSIKRVGTIYDQQGV